MAHRIGRCCPLVGGSALPCVAGLHDRAAARHVAVGVRLALRDARHSGWFGWLGFRGELRDIYTGPRNFSLATPHPRVHDEDRPIDVAHSTLTVLVSKSGLFSAFADNHVIKAPILSGTLQEDAPRKVEVSVRAADLQVLDPGLSPSRRADVQAGGDSGRRR